MEKEKLNEISMGNIAGGQLTIDDVLGVEGLFMCTGAPTENNPEGVFWELNGISLTKDEAMKLLKKKSTRPLDEEKLEEAFLAEYIKKYNDQVNGNEVKNK